MRIGKISAAFAVIVLCGLGWLGWYYAGQKAETVLVNSTEGRSVFFRLLAKYQHGDEIIDFDIVVGCAVKVTGYGYGGSSYDAFRDPIFFVKATADGAAVLQIVPDACQGQTTENRQVPADFMPGAIWFDDAKDFSLGVAYVSEDAFENEKSKLRFLGASIHKATRTEWEAFQPTAAQNLLDQRPYIFGTLDPSPDEVSQDPWNKQKLRSWLPVLACRGYARYRVTDPALKDLIVKYRPQDQPVFWAPNLQHRQRFLDLLFGGDGPDVEGVPLKQYMRSYHQRGFATRAQGGQFYSGNAGSQLPSRLYPLRAEDGVPWIDIHIADAPMIYRDLDLAGGSNAGFLYCYASLLGATDDFRSQLMPDYQGHRFITRIDGRPVEPQGSFGIAPPDPPSPFFETDEYFYLDFAFHLS